MHTRRRVAICGLAVVLAAILGTAWAADDVMLKLHLRSRAKDAGDAKPPAFTLAQKQGDWDPRKTAIIVCDMWDKHWCKGATARVAEMAVPMNEMLKAARAKGVFVIHCPSSVTNFYKDTPQRKLAQSAPFAKAPIDMNIGWCGRDGGRESDLPIDDSDGGCDDQPRCKQGSPWRRQIDTIEIADADAITDKGQETWNLLQMKGIDNVLLCGVYLNMCVLGRPFSIRQMVKCGKNVALIRDMTDTMYNHEKRPMVPHFVGTDLMVEHVEKYWCASITSIDITGASEPFHFKADARFPAPAPSAPTPNP